VVQALVPVVDIWHPVSLEVPRGASRERLEAALRSAGVSADRVRGADSVAAAIDQLQSLPAADRLLLTGSFVTVAQALERAKQE